MVDEILDQFQGMIYAPLDDEHGSSDDVRSEADFWRAEDGTHFNVLPHAAEAEDVNFVTGLADRIGTRITKIDRGGMAFNLNGPCETREVGKVKPLPGWNGLGQRVPWPRDLAPRTKEEALMVYDDVMQQLKEQAESSEIHASRSDLKIV